MTNVFSFLACLFLGMYSLGANAMMNPLPPGSYQSTCRTCIISMQNGDLECMCKDRNGIDIQSSLPNPSECDNVENSSGYLRCLRWKDNPEPYRPQPYNPPRYPEVKKSYSAGPIWNQADAERKCPRVCASHHHWAWTGHWETTQWASNSMCECVRPHRRY